jgi:hypothetical protein
MICASIGETTIEGCLRALEATDFAEIRVEKQSLAARNFGFQAVVSHYGLGGTATREELA